jgi:hypothetical protein
VPTAVIDSLDGMFHVYDPEAQCASMDERFRFLNGLVEVEAPPFATVVCAHSDTKIPVTLDRLDRPEDAPDPGWEAIAEVSIFTTSGKLQVGDWGGRPVAELFLEGLPKESWVRLRVHARGRDREGHEEFLLQAWPGPQTDEQVLRQDRFGENYR